MTHSNLVEKMLNKGMTYKEATAEANRIKERANYLTKITGYTITAEDIIETEA